MAAHRPVRGFFPLLPDPAILLGVKSDFILYSRVLVHICEAPSSPLDGALVMLALALAPTLRGDPFS